MKLSLESGSDINEIISYGDDHIVIRTRNNSNLLRLEKDLILTPLDVVQNKTFSDDISSDELNYLKMHHAEIVLITQPLTPQSLVRFSAHSIGVESMSLGSACRTYNLLANEGRQVIFVVKF